MLNRFILIVILLFVGFGQAEKNTKDPYFLFPNFSQAEKFSEGIHIFTESALSLDYNVLFSMSNIVYRENLFFSFDNFYFRIMKDTNTWRFNTSLPLNALITLVLFGTYPPPPNAPDNPFVPFRDMGGLLLNIPLVLLNPTVGLKLTEWFNVGVGYNTSYFIGRPKWLYFAPKFQTQWRILPLAIEESVALTVTTTVSYQVFDCLAVKRGVRFGLSLGLS